MTSATVLRNETVAAMPRSGGASVARLTVEPPPPPLSDKLQLTNKPIVVAVDAGHGGWGKIPVRAA